MLRVHFRARRSGIVLIGLALTVAIGSIRRGGVVSMPLIDRGVPVNLVAVLVVATLLTIPLLEPMPGLSASFVRERPVRLLSTLATLAAFTISWLTLTLGATPPKGDVFIAWTIFGLAPISVALLGAAGWIGPLAIGALIVFIDGGQQSPVSTLVEPLSLSPYIAASLVVVIASAIPHQRSMARPDSSD